ncbi:unnamed protein product [Musa acuminata subsp. malaccensis]|uniref:(wild Malaysian banana) hypothetical protein n=1 Tax=Musa acuminata subsp. malaccensis TaxID=214687 RepID=A0A804J6E0_MUSAM|nr:unnamed protein product [Musa acuminata subsp. malaccensis]
MASKLLQLIPNPGRTIQQVLCVSLASPIVPHRENQTCCICNCPFFIVVICSSFVRGCRSKSIDRTT